MIAEPVPDDRPRPAGHDLDEVSVVAGGWSPDARAADRAFEGAPLDQRARPAAPASDEVAVRAVVKDVVDDLEAVGTGSDAPASAAAVGQLAVLDDHVRVARVGQDRRARVL